MELEIIDRLNIMKTLDSIKAKLRTEFERDYNSTERALVMLCLYSLVFLIAASYVLQRKLG